MPSPLLLLLRPHVAAVSALALLLAGCSSRDTAMAEKLARAEAAAKRAEEAADRAEAALKRMPIARPPAPAPDDEADTEEPAFGEPTVRIEPAA